MVQLQKEIVKNCAWGTCNSDWRYPERLINSNGKSVKFYHFPSLEKEKLRRKAWIKPCCWGNNFVCTKHSYICGFHFVCNNGPTDKHPDLIPATASREKVRQCMFALAKFAYILLYFTYLTGKATE